MKTLDTLHVFEMKLQEASEMNAAISQELLSPLRPFIAAARADALFILLETCAGPRWVA
jgi:hypothetical protein